MDPEKHFWFHKNFFFMDLIKVWFEKILLLGPKGSWTPFHSDVFGSFSWSANVAGFKKWIFIPKGQEPKDIYDILEILPKSNGFSFNIKEHQEISYFEIKQGPGEAIFVPSGWYHQVLNLTDTLSINHNWFNATNLLYIWDQLYQELKKVQKELSDIFEQNDTEWKENCQNLLLASHGMNISTFLDLLGLIYSRRARNLGSYEHFTLGPNHVEYDLIKVKQMLSLIMSSAKDDLMFCDVVKLRNILDE